MPTPNKEIVRAALEVDDRDLKIRDAIQKAWADVQVKYPDRAWWHRASTLRHVMWEHSVDRVMEVVGDDAGLVSIPHHDTTSFIADDLVFFRLKKADRSLFSSNYQTPLARLFHRHEADLFGHNGFHRVEIVHTLNRLQTDIDWIGVVARDGKKVIWDLELRRREGSVVPFPVAPTQPAGKTVIVPNLPGAGEQNQETQ